MRPSRRMSFRKRTSSSSAAASSLRPDSRPFSESRICDDIAKALQCLSTPLSRNFCGAAQGQEAGGFRFFLGHTSNARSRIDEIGGALVDIGAYGLLLVGAADQLLLLDRFRKQRRRRID